MKYIPFVCIYIGVFTAMIMAWFDLSAWNNTIYYSLIPMAVGLALLYPKNQKAVLWSIIVLLLLCWIHTAGKLYQYQYMIENFGNRGSIENGAFVFHP